MKRFYKKAVPSKSSAGYEILLDGKPVKLPSGKPLTCSSESVANEVAAEWNNQADIVKPDAMPLTQILTTALERTGSERPVLTQQVLNYLNTDLIFYMAEDEGVSVPHAKAQEKNWRKWIKFFSDMSKSELVTTTGLAAIKQPDEIHVYVSERINNMDDMYFTLLQILTAETGSLLLSLAFLEGQMDTKQLFEATFVDDLVKADIHHADTYGHDPHTEKKWAEFKALTAACEICLKSD